MRADKAELEAEPRQHDGLKAALTNLFLRQIAIPNQKCAVRESNNRRDPLKIQPLRRMSQEIGFVQGDLENSSGLDHPNTLAEPRGHPNGWTERHDPQRARSRSAAWFGCAPTQAPRLSLGGTPALMGEGGLNSAGSMMSVIVVDRQRTFSCWPLSAYRTRTRCSPGRRRKVPTQTSSGLQVRLAGGRRCRGWPEASR